MVWDVKDQGNYLRHRMAGRGQICNDSFSEEIKSYASNEKYKTFLEIGTWNGLGSTKAFAEGFMLRNDDYVFYSLECNKDKCMDASRLYTNFPNMHILNEVIWNEEPHDFYEIFPQCLSDEMFKHWNTVDIENMKKCKLFLERDNLPDVFDVLLLDGGEFTTYYEFQILKNRCKILMMDDTKTDKCKLIVDEIRHDSSWRILKEGNTRNGFMIIERIITN